MGCEKLDAKAYGKTGLRRALFAEKTTRKVKALSTGHEQAAQIGHQTALNHRGGKQAVRVEQPVIRPGVGDLPDGARRPSACCTNKMPDSAMMRVRAMMMTRHRLHSKNANASDNSVARKVMPRRWSDSFVVGGASDED